MSQRPAQQPTGKDIYQMAEAVVTRIPTLEGRVPAESVQAYHDSRISIEANHRADLLKITISVEDQNVIVFQQAMSPGAQPAVHRPGKWTNYLAELHTKALTRTPEPAPATSKPADTRFEPIDDSHTFPKEPQSTGPARNPLMKTLEGWLKPLTKFGAEYEITTDEVSVTVSLVTNAAKYSIIVNWPSNRLDRPEGYIGAIAYAHKGNSNDGFQQGPFNRITWLTLLEEIIAFEMASAKT